MTIDLAVHGNECGGLILFRQLKLVGFVGNRKGRCSGKHEHGTQTVGVLKMCRGGSVGGAAQSVSYSVLQIICGR